MKMYALIVITKNGRFYYDHNEGNFKPLMFKTDILFTKLQDIDLFTSSFKNAKHLGEMTSIGSEVSELYIMDNDEKKIEGIVFNDKLSEYKKGMSSSSLIDKVNKYLFIKNKDKKSDGLRSLLNDYKEIEKELKKANLDDEYIIGELCDKKNNLVCEISNWFNSYEKLRELILSQEVYDKYINNSLVFKDLKNNKGDLYTLVAINQEGEEYYYEPSRNEFFSKLCFENGFRPKRKLIELDSLTSSIQDISKMEGVPSDLKDFYIVYRNNDMDIKIPAIFDDLKWLEIVKDSFTDFDNRLKINPKTDITIPILEDIDVKLNDKDSLFYDMLLDDDYKKACPLNKHIKKQIQGYVENFGGQEYSGLGFEFLLNAITYYNEFRSVYLNLGFFNEKTQELENEKKK